MKQPSVIIVGAGFAGTACYQLLKRQTDWGLTIVDPDAEFEYTPGIHEALTHPRRVRSLRLPYSILFGKDFIQGFAKSITGHTVVVGKQRLKADYIVLAAGASANIPDQFKAHCVALKTLTDIDTISARLNPKLPINVIGGGYTGVEVAGVLADAGYQVCLIHSRDRLLDSMAPGVSAQCANRLTSKGVKIVLGDRLKSATSKQLKLSSGALLPSGVNILTIGSAPNMAMYPFETTDVSPYCHLQSQPHIFVAGDLALEKALPTAHNAMVLGRFVANQLIRAHAGKPLRSFVESLRPLAISYGDQAGAITLGQYGLYLPYGIGIAKRVIEWRVLFEFRYNVPLPL